MGSGNNLFEASKQWSTRPDDERFSSLREMHEACAGYHAKSKTEYYDSSKFYARSQDEELVIDLDDRPIRFSNWGFHQLAAKADAPESYLRKLPAQLAADCINIGLNKMEHCDVQTLIHTNGEDRICRALMTPSYKRIWNDDVLNFLQGLYDEGWRVPPARPALPNQKGSRPATEEDLLNCNNFELSVQLGDMIAPAGLYASDHDMFAFMVEPNNAIDDGSGKGLYRGFFLWNSEVGASVVGAKTFLWRHVCGNHICWDVEGVKELKIKHIGTANHKFTNDFKDNLIEYVDSAASVDENMITAAKNKILGKDKDEVVITVLKRFPKMGKRMIASAYDTAENYDYEDGNPRSVWGLINGMTRLSQDEYTDNRVALDNASGQLLKLAA